MTKIIGIDPGMKGAIACIDNRGMAIEDMPVMGITKGKSKRDRFDPYAYQDILQSFGPISMAYIEQVSAQPGNGAAQAFTYGWGCGGVETGLAFMNIPFTYVTPMKWKKVLGCPKEKDEARMRASQLMPNFREFWPLKKHDGRAEAALIAYYGFNLEG